MYVCMQKRCAIFQCYIVCEKAKKAKYLHYLHPRLPDRGCARNGCLETPIPGDQQTTLSASSSQDMRTCESNHAHLQISARAYKISCGGY